MNEPIFTIRIAIDGEQSAGNIIACCKSQNLIWKIKNNGKIIEIEAEDPLEFYYLGANVTALSSGLFEGSLTTHAANQHKQ